MDNPAEVVSKRLSWELESWTSIEVRSHEELRNPGAVNDPTQWPKAHFEHHYVETAAGQRLFEVRIIPSNGEKFRKTNYAAKDRAADVLFTDAGGWDHQQVTIKRAFGMENRTGWPERPEPLRALYVGLVPLPKALKSAVSLGGARHLDRDCDVFLFPGVTGGQRPVDAVYLLDRATAVPLKRSIYPDETARTEDRPETVWSAESLDEVEGHHHLPLKSTVTHYGGDPRTVRLQVQIVVDEVHYNRDFPVATFWPVLGADAVVQDEITGKTTFPSLDVIRARRAATAAESSAPPIRAIPPGSGALSLSAVMLGAGLAILIVGLVLWWRRR